MNITTATFNQVNQFKLLSKSLAIFKCIQPIIMNRFEKYLSNLKHSTRGCKRKLLLDTFFKALYLVLSSGAKISDLRESLGIAKATFYRYFKQLRNSQIIPDLYGEVLKNQPLDETLLSDTFTVKSLDGSEGLGANPTDRGRQGLKVSLVTDLKGVITDINCFPANRHDSKLLKETLKTRTGVSDKILLDSAYIGKPVHNWLESQGIRAIVVPKKMGNGNYSHQLDNHDQALIKKRWRIERTIGILRRYRAINLKFSKTLQNYNFLLKIAVLITICSIIFI